MVTTIPDTQRLINEQMIDDILVLSFNSTNPHNPFSKEMREAVTTRLLEAQKDSELKAIILTGGINKSFCVGGDFNETIRFDTPEQVEDWITSVIDLYTASLELKIPTVAAIDHHAIGIGFQLALTCDWRIGSDRCSFMMPELKNGIACTLGSFMLTHLLSRAQMQKIVFGCASIDAASALQMNLLHDTVPADELLTQALVAARKLSEYPEIPWRGSKQMINRSFIDGLKGISEGSKAVHVDSFMSRSGTEFFNYILTRNH
jgi:carboxymethylproline synthase